MASMTLKQRRKTSGRTLASVAGAVGITVGYLWMIENGKKSPRAWVLERLAAEFGCAVSEIQPGGEQHVGGKG